MTVGTIACGPSIAGGTLGAVSGTIRARIEQAITRQGPLSNTTRWKLWLGEELIRNGVIFGTRSVLEAIINDPSSGGLATLLVFMGPPGWSILASYLFLLGVPDHWSRYGSYAAGFIGSQLAYRFSRSRR